MNWLFIVVVAVVAGFAILGYWKGILKIIYSFIAWILIFGFVTVSSPFIKQFMINHTTIYEKIAAHCEENIWQSIEEGSDKASQNFLNAITNGNMADLGISLPDSVLDNIADGISGFATSSMAASGLYEEISKRMADFVVQGLSFFIALAIAILVAILISGLIGAVSKIPVLSGVNRICGLFAGTVYGLLMVWIAFYLIAICSASETGAVLVSYIYKSKLLAFLYENNLVLTVMLKFL